MYIISDDNRRYLDAMLHTFLYDRIVDIRGSVEKIASSENDSKSFSETLKIRSEIENFLAKNGFGHLQDHVFIIDKKGIDLKNTGSLAAYETFISN
jgi:hypothetical protein